MKFPPEWQQAIDFFVSTFAELAILFVLISILVSMINYYLPGNKVRQLLSGNRGYGIAMALGAVTPFCSCSTLPMLVGLLKARAAFGPLMAFLITSPLLNPYVFALFWLTFGVKVTLLYSIGVLTVAALAGYCLQQLGFERFIRPELLQPATPPNSSCTAASDNIHCNSASPTLARTNSSLANSSTIAAASCCSEKLTISPQVYRFDLPVRQLIKDAISQLRTMLPYMILGVAAGAALHGFVPVTLFNQLASVDNLIMIPLAALIGIFLYVRASTMIPIASSLLAKGLSMGTVMSLTIAGAGASLPEMIMLKKIFHWPLLLAFGMLVLATACITGFSIELLA